MSEAGGYQAVRTPDDGPIATQDAYFSRCIDIILHTWNIVLKENQT